MDGNIDPSKNTANKAFQGSNKTNVSNDGGNLMRPAYNSVWVRQPSTDINIQFSSSGEEQFQAASIKKTSFPSNAPNLLPQQQNTHYPGSQQPVPPSNIINELPHGSTPQSAQSQVNIVEQTTKPYWESGGDSFEEWQQDQSEGHQGEHCGTEPPPYYYQEESYSHGKPYKKKGFSNKIDRFVQRFPVLGKFYKQPPNSPFGNQAEQEFKYDQMSDASGSNKLERELTADELALNDRYLDKAHIKCIKLQEQNHIQPVDLSIHQATNKIYSCDVGRSLIEIFDINGTLQHVINDSIISKFQPTAIAIASDETIIIASHFNHCLHMYSPNQLKTDANSYSYKQFKLGAPGDQIHQFYHPAGIAIDHTDGYLYVCDRGNCRIQVMTPDGICERVIQLYLNDKKKSQLDPVRVALQQISNHIICIIGPSDTICFIPKDANGRVYVDPLYIMDTNGLGLESASGLAVDIHDRVFIADTGHNRIVICTPEGGFITSIGTEGDGPGQFKRPCGLDVTNDGTIAVTDPGNKRIQLLGLIDKQTPLENSPPEENSNVVINNLLADEKHDEVSTM